MLLCQRSLSCFKGWRKGKNPARNTVSCNLSSAFSVANFHLFGREAKWEQGLWDSAAAYRVKGKGWRRSFIWLYGRDLYGTIIFYISGLDCLTFCFHLESDAPPFLSLSLFFLFFPRPLLFLWGSRGLSFGFLRARALNWVYRR